MHDIPLAAFTADGPSVIASKGRSSYARAMIEIDVDVELKETVTVVVPNLEGEGYTCEK
ncbi:hypothetical protein Tco_0314783, partial [Tanacetum coccineum]